MSWDKIAGILDAAFTLELGFYKVSANTGTVDYGGEYQAMYNSYHQQTGIMKDD